MEIEIMGVVGKMCMGKLIWGAAVPSSHAKHASAKDLFQLPQLAAYMTMDSEGR